MSKIETQTEVAPVRIKNEALISRNGWLLIGGIVTLLLGTVLLTDSDYKIPFVISFKTEMLHDYFSIFESRIFVVSIVITAIFVLLHTWLISRKMDDWYLRYKHQM
jgi:membrane-bound ClpP family serine protease